MKRCDLAAVSIDSSALFSLDISSSDFPFSSGTKKAKRRPSSPCCASRDPCSAPRIETQRPWPPLRRRDTVARRPQSRWEDLLRHDEGGVVWAEVGEEEGQGVHDDEVDVIAQCGPAAVRHCKGVHEDSHEKEAHGLDGEASNDVDEGDGEPVTWYAGIERDEDLRKHDPEDLLDGVHGGGLRDPVDGGKDVLLEQVLAVEGDVEEDQVAAVPRRCRPWRRANSFENSPKLFASFAASCSTFPCSSTISTWRTFCISTTACFAFYATSAVYRAVSGIFDRE
ncbi:hypothetical protein ZIOFF_013055 [Zingiber officinale]|uniref:Uncharacterized protein n=1 Tax=Zingiber officinale TaxID=94328 RepID=A0A8J5LKL8_ZINOF|nr:hypothetical protein ZIOFF_013055 [Zingiber officinale]